MMIVTPGYVYRWFNVDWATTPELQKAVDQHHDAIFDALASMKNAKEVNSGHSGFNVVFEDDKRTDDEIIAAIVKVMAKFN
jgi:DNA polymerase III epsilon subunit-like protein